MAVRTPLYWDGSDIREMSDSHITAIRNRCIYLYGANPSVDLSQVSSGGNISPSMTDTRLQAGPATFSPFNSGRGPNTPTNSGDDYNFSITGVSPVEVTYDRITQNIESVTQQADTNNRRNFVYQINGDIYAMSHTDMYDTFYDDVIDDLTDGNNRPGIYTIKNTYSITNFTRISDTEVFRDTRANAAAYTASGIPETRDQPTTIANWYIHRVDQSIMTNPSITHPLLIRSDNDLQQHNDTTVDTILTNDIRYWAAQKLRYNINGTGNQRGDPMTNTILNSSVRRNQQIGDTGASSTTYRSQQMPAGSQYTASTFTLKIQRV